VDKKISTRSPLPEPWKRSIADMNSKSGFFVFPRRRSRRQGGG
jgi:hypothetical protein